MDTQPHSALSFLAVAARWLAYFVGTVVALVALFYVEEDWRGRHAWDNYKRERIAAGDHLANDFAWYLPKPVPDDQNFYKTPLLQLVGYGHGFSPKGPATEDVAKRVQPFSFLGDAIGSIQDGKRSNLKLAQQILQTNEALVFPPMPRDAAADIALVSEQSPELTELRQASVLPYAQCDGITNPLSGDIPNFVYLRAFAQILALSEAAELALNHPDKAVQNQHVLEQFVNALHGNQTLISAMIRVAIAGVAVEPFWEGWADNKWSDRQLEQFQDFFQSANLVADVDRSFRTAERAWGEYYVERPRSELIKDFFPNSDHLKSSEKRGLWMVRLAPKGWFYQNIVVHHRMLDQLISGATDPPNRRVFPEKLSANTEQFNRFVKKKSRSPFRILAEIGIPNTSRAFNSAAQNQTYLQEAAIVCALERFHHSHGQYPDSLDELAPKFINVLPDDVIGGKPYHYQKTGWKFLLYSVGWDGKDNGGDPGRPGRADSGDWVWPYPKEN